MPILSAFTPCGMLTMSSLPSHAETIHGALVKSQGEAYRVNGELNVRQDAKLYAQAMGLARAQYALQGAGNQQFAAKAWDLFPVLEAEHGLVPRPSDTLAERRGALAARMLLPGGASQVNVQNALTALLGDDFIAYIPTAVGDEVLYPTAIGDQPMNLQLPSVLRKLVQIEPAVTTGLGFPQSVVYQDLLADPAPDTISAVPILLVGDHVVVGPDDNGNTETVEVEASSVFVIDELNYELRFTATFNKPHPAATLCSTMPYPFWASTKRHSLVVLSATAAADAEARRKTNDLMQRIARGVSTWDVAGETSPGSGVAGPFTVGGGLLGITPIGAVTL